MDSEGFITLEEAAMLPCPYQPPYSELNLPFDATILAEAANAGVLAHKWQNRAIVTQPEWVEQWGRRPLGTIAARSVRPIVVLSSIAVAAGLLRTQENGEPVQDPGLAQIQKQVQEALEHLPPSSTQRDVENELIKRQKTERHKPIKSPSLPYTVTSARPSPLAVTQRVRKLLKSPHIIRATVEDAFPLDNPSNWQYRLVWALKHKRDPHTLNKLPNTWHGTWPEWAAVLKRYDIDLGDEHATRARRDMLGRVGNAEYARAIEDSLFNGDKLGQLWGFGIRNTPKGYEIDHQDWIVTPEIDAEPYIFEIRRQLLASRRHSEPYRDKAKATTTTPDKWKNGPRREKSSQVSAVQTIDDQNALARSRESWVWTHQIPEVED